MKLATFWSGGSARPGLVDGDEIVELSGFSSTLEVIERGPEARADLEAALGEGRRRPLDENDLAAPVTPPVVYGVGWNYLKHFEEGAAKRDEDLPEHPAFFVKSRGSVIGPYDDIPLHAEVTSQLDWEAELGVVVGRVMKDATPAAALDYVFGYTVGNDVSAREVQRRHGGQWVKGKSLDGTCPLGPWIVTADEIGDPQSLTVESRVNGEIKQKATTDRMIFPVAELLARLSQGMTLYPGDVLLTGTPEGVGMGRTPPEYLAEGDVVECEVSGIGTIRNRITG
jgi:2,4-diketo-3-deoxy-L-fuconate hydrolase